MCDHYEEYYWPYHESCEPDPLDGFGGAPAESLSLTTFADVPRTIRVAALDDPEGEPDDFIAIDLSETPTPREGLHFPPSDEFGYSL